MKILVVDDVAFNRMFLEKVLVKAGYDVVSSSCSLQALQILEEDASIGAVFSDLLMDRLDGVQLILECQNLKRYKSIGGLLMPPFVLVTSVTDEDQLKEATDAGYFKVISKPFEADTVLTLAQAIEKGKHLDSSSKKNLEILALDPSGEIEAMVKPIIEGTDNKIIRSTTYKEGLQTFQINHNIGAVVASFNLDEENGLLFFEACKKMERYNDHGSINVPPFILIADSIDNDSLVNAVKKGIKEVLVKPFDRGRLEDKLTEIYREKQKVEQNDKSMLEKRILVVDDIGFNRTLLEQVLKKEGYKVKVVATGEAALEQFTTYEEYDLVVCDLMLPDIDGIELLQQVKSLATEDSNKLSEKKVTCPPFIMITSCNEGDRLENAKAAGYRSILHKPLNVAEFKTQVGAQLVGL